ncbi:MAG: ABC transporter ATP-binding protein [Clostridiales bacterium]|nr:ABC transporter ATP-binding protein [Clostridiales bacterium]
MNENKNNNRPRRPSPGPGGGGPMAMMPGAKAKDFKGTFRKLLSYIRPYILLLLIVGVFAMLGTVFSLAGPFMQIKVTNSIQQSVENATNIEFGFIGKVISTLIVIYLLSALFTFLQGYITVDIAQKISFEMRQNIANKINKIPLRYFDSNPHGDTLSRITNDVDTVSNSMQQIFTQLITSVITIVGILTMMIIVSPLMTLIALLTVPLSLFFVRVIVNKSQKHFKAQQETLGEINGYVEEMYSSHNIVKAFNMEEESISAFNEVNDKLFDSGWKANFLSGLIMPVVRFVGNLGYVAVSIVGGWLAIKRVIGVGEIAAFIVYIRQFNQPITQTANIANVLQSTMAAAERVFEFLEQDEEPEDPQSPILVENAKGNVEFRNIKFGYDKNRTIINNVSIKVKSGQRVAIVGPTGAGKTTLINLLMRFYDVDDGAILVDGVDIRDMRRADLRAMFGMVLQDTWLFGGTIKENIAYGNLNATDEEVCNAAKVAYADHFIRTNPDGYDMEINEEASNISGGQKQLMTIARAVLTNPRILILDEATSSVDTRTELRIQRAMDNLMKGRTSFIIAHRLSTIRDADIILVMRDGDIVEQGSHDELIELDGFYASLYNSQFQGNAV